MWTVLLSLASAADEPDPITARVGVAASIDKHSPMLGLHLAASNPAGPFRTGARYDFRGWQYPTRDELGFWADNGVSGLPDHWEWEMTASMGVRKTHPLGRSADWRVQPGIELALCAGYWHYATAAVQDEYAAAGAVKWPLEEARIGPEVLIGLFSPWDDLSLVYMHRAYLPLHARLDGEGGRYHVGDQVFEPIEVVNPMLEAGLAGVATRDKLYARVEATWRLTLSSAKNRAVDQSPPDGTVLVMVSGGRAF
ncbi:MAG: hypothetical protein GY884_15935 [Proteobacteria bacterium]|nr:hypothetical protein [Pseudomonadota bacterium]